MEVKRKFGWLKTGAFAIRADTLVVFALLIASLGLSLWKFDWFQVGSAWDDAHYIVLAKSIVIGQDYGLVNPPGKVLPTRYPFGWPLILAPVYALFSGDFQALKLVSLFFTLANTLIIWAGWKHLGISNRTIGLATAGLYALSPFTIANASEVMSEPAFTFFLLLGVVLSVRPAQSSRSQILDAVALGVVWMFTAYIRTIGPSLVIGSAFYLILKKKRVKFALAAGSFLTALLAVLAFTDIRWPDLVNFGEYLDQFENPAKWGQLGAANGLATRGEHGLAEYFIFHVRDILIPFIGTEKLQQSLNEVHLGWLPVFVSAIVLGLLAIGCVMSIRKAGILPIHLSLPIYMAILGVWPYTGVRFIFPILAFLYAYLLSGASMTLAAVSERTQLGRHKQNWGALLGLGLLTLLFCAQLVQISRLDSSLKHLPDLSVGTTWIKRNAPNDAVVVAEQPQIAYLYSERSAVELTGNIQGLMELADQRSVYLLIAPELEWHDDGKLNYDPLGQMVLNTLESGILRGKLVFEDRAALVKVYLIENKTYY